jgi:hypothetical protein
MIKVGICVPTRDAWRAHFGQSLAMVHAAFGQLLPDGVRGGIKMFNKTQCSIVHLARNELAQLSLDSDCTHIWFVDDDMQFPMNTLNQLLSHDKDVVAANCVTKENPPRPTSKALNSKRLYTTKHSTGLEEVESTGTGCILIKREVFEGMKKPWFDFEWIDAEANAVLGEDRYFCREARKAGFEIYIDHDISKQVMHMGDWPYCHQMTDEYHDN